jgi:hypothetical protein
MGSPVSVRVLAFGIAEAAEVFLQVSFGQEHACAVGALVMLVRVLFFSHFFAS